MLISKHKSTIIAEKKCAPRDTKLYSQKRWILAMQMNNIKGEVREVLLDN